MARSRNIKPGLTKNEVLAEMGPHAQILFAMLPCYADREGRLEDRPKRIKAEVFPYYDVDVDDLLRKLSDSDERFIVRYEIAGSRYLQITNFDKHQCPHHKESASTLPPPPKQEPSNPQATPKHDNVGAHASVKGISNKVKGIKEEEALELERIDDQPLAEAARSWLLYKIERRERYKTQGLKAFVTQVISHAKDHGPAAVIAVIQTSMSSNYVGVMWDKITSQPKPKPKDIDFVELLKERA